ncbi:MAG TPA: CRISPR-associated protein Cas4 [Blastocatellia bacterium]|nr:CRISPR-associated protein Cas4 [Blastocatellia bacterium]
MIWLLVAFLICVVLASVIDRAAHRVASQAGLPEGKLIYSDTGFAIGKLGPVTTDEYGRKVERPLVSERFGLIGRPDYLVDTGDGIIPVEVKSARLPASGQPYDSHVLQFAAYCLLVEDLLDPEVDCGIIRYRDAEVKVAYTPQLRIVLLDVIEDMRAARRAAEVHRSHDERGRCAACRMREVCDEALV